MKKITFAIGLLGLVIFVANLSAKTIEVGVSQVAVISPGERELDPLLGPRICLKFDLPEEVSGIEIGFADLVLGVAIPPRTEDSLALFEAFALTSSWNENVAWGDFATPGGSLDSSLYATYTHRCGRDSLISLDVTFMAQAWNETPGSNFGLILIPRKTDWGAFREHSFTASE